MMKSMFLSKSEIIELTGAKYAKRQGEWLAKHGYLFDVRRDKSIAILREHLIDKLGSSNNQNYHPVIIENN